MNIFQITTGALFGFLIFVAIFFGESKKFSFTNLTPHPKNITQSTFQEKESNTPETIVWSNYEMLTTGLGTTLDLNDNIRVLIDGDLLLNTHFIVSENKTAFSNSHFGIQAGPIWIQAIKGRVFISRDKLQQQTTVLAIDQSIEIYFNKTSAPFVVPAGMRVIVRDRNINKNTHKVYDSQLRQIFRLRSIIDTKSINHGEIFWSKNLSPKIREFLDIEKIFINKNFREFLYDTPYIWKTKGYNETLAKARLWLYKVRESTIPNIDYSQHIQEYYFRNFMRPLSDALINTTNNESNNISLHIKKFNNQSAQKNKITSKHKAHIDELIVFAQGTFFAAQSDAEEIFYLDLFHNQQADKEYKEIFAKFSLFERYLYLQNFQKAKEALQEYADAWNEILKQTNIQESTLRIATRHRRIIKNLIITYSKFQDVDIVSLYKQLINAESRLPKDGIYQEIRLESAQEILQILRKFFDNDVSYSIANILIQTYESLNIAKIEKSLNRAIFTPEEEKTLQIVLFAASRKDIQNIDRIIELYNKAQEDIDKNFSFETKNTEESHGVRNAGNLKSLLTDFNFSTRSWKINLQKNGRFISFEGVNYENKKVSGVFDINRQVFSILRFDSLSYNQVGIFNLQNTLQKVQHAITLQEDSPEAPPVSTRNIVSQNTAQAIVNRKRAQNELFFLNIPFSQIEILDSEHKEIMIKEAVFEGGISLSFIYFPETKKIQKISQKNKTMKISATNSTELEAELKRILERGKKQGR